MVKIQDDGNARHIRVNIKDHVATVILDRPDKKNAVTGAMWRQLSEIFAGFGQDPSVRAIIIRGAGTDFCAGADIAEFDEIRRDAETSRQYEATNDDAFSAIRNCPVPVIAAIRGICFGGGFGIAAATDLRIATQDARFSVPAARLGLAYPVAAMADIVDAVGRQMAGYLVYSGGRLDAEQALAAGFLLEICPDGTLDTRALELASGIAQNAPLSVKASKAAIRAALSGNEEDFEHADMIGRQTFDSRDYAEGRAAFAARRKPLFEGR